MQYNTTYRVSPIPLDLYSEQKQTLKCLMYWNIFISNALTGQMMVGWIGAEPFVFDGAADGEMVETLVLVIFES